MSKLEYAFMLIGFALWFYVGYKIGHNRATNKWIKSFCDIVNGSIDLTKLKNK